MTDVPDTPAAPEGRVAPRYSDPTAGAPPWTEVERLIAEAELFWISTVRPDGRPHVVPTTGVNPWARGYDVVVEGRAERVTDDARLRGLAALWEEEFGDFWHFEVREGHLHHGPGRAVVFSVAPRTVFGFGKGEPFSRTRWRFA